MNRKNFAATGFAALFLLASIPASAQLLSLVEKETGGSLGGAVAAALHPSGDVLLVVAEYGKALNSYTRDSGTGLLTLADSEVDGQGGVEGIKKPNGLAISPDGAYVYVSSNQGGQADGAIAIFTVDGSTGALGFVAHVLNNPPAIDGIWMNKGVAISNDGAYVVASGRTDPAAPKGAVALFTRDSGTGLLTFVDIVKNTVTPGATGLGQGGRPVFGPNGQYFYVSAEGGNAVTFFSIDSGSDSLVVEGTVANGVGGVAGLGGASSVTFSPDGAHAYVTGATSNSVSHFTVNVGTGEIAEQQTITDGVGGVDGLAGASGAALNPAGNRLYVAGPGDNAVAVFARAADGSLLYLGFAQDGVGGLDGLGGAAAVGLSPDGSYLYAAASGEAAVGVFGPGDGEGGDDAIDFGDAPDPTFATLLASDGARHTITDGALRLGSALDAETDGQPTATADGDDLALTDDDDGVTFDGTFAPGQSGSATVTASAAGLLDAWVDWNNDGDWGDTGEQIAASAAVVAGPNTVNFSVPVTAAPNATVTARFRLSSAGALAPTGLAADGEVEDYATATGNAADLGATPSGDVTVDWLDPYTLTITVNNIGPGDVTGASVAIALSANSGAVTWTCVATNGACTANGAGDVADTADILAGGNLVYTISGTVPDEAVGPYITASATVAAPVGTFDPVSSNDTATARVKILSIFLDGFETGDTSRWTLDFP